MLRRFFLLGILIGTVAARSRWDEEGREWWKNVEYLASGKLEGRNVGTRGFELAADYVAEQYERTGLEAAGGDGYFQKIWFSEASLTWARMRLTRHGRSQAIAIPSEALIHFNPHSGPGVKAPLVFAGYGLQIPEAGYDDLEGLPIKGAVVAYLMGAPAEIPASLRAHYSSSEMRWQAFQAAGAVGMIAIPNPKTMNISWGNQAATIGMPRLTLLDGRLNDLDGLQFSASWNPWQADNLLEGSGHTFAEILAADAAGTALPHFAIDCTLNVGMTVSSRIVGSKNVVAVHPGSDESLTDEYVVVSAHLDHLGADERIHGHGIYHGAMDDASGVSSLIEIAKMLKNVRTKRSIVFLALTGEEEGELGSKYFAKYPPVKGRMVADLNMDMFLPLFPLKWLEVQGLDESTLGEDIKAVAEEAGVKVQADKEPNQNRFSRSDQYSFVKAGIPSVAFKFGYQKGDPEEKIVQHWYATRYHGVKDDAYQPVDLAAAAQFNDILRALLVRVADADEAPSWKADSFFKRFTTSSGM